jgi:hypothetical protein
LPRGPRRAHTRRCGDALAGGYPVLKVVKNLPTETMTFRALTPEAAVTLVDP